jgi:two-component system, NarL family, nitrate/nitrite response regulator NarL
MVSVAVVADIPIHREGLRHALARRTGLEVVGTAGSSPEALEPIAELRPDVVVVDVAASDGVAAVRTVFDTVPDAGVVAVALTASDADLVACAEAGATGYVAREEDVGDMDAVIKSVARGEARFPPTITAMLFRRLAAMSAPDRSPMIDAHLTRRETEVLELMAKGYSNSEIGLHLSIALSTVKHHVHSILDKLHVEGRGAAVALLSGQRTRHRRDIARPPSGANAGG